MSLTTDSAVAVTGLWSMAPEYSMVTFSVRHHGSATFRSAFTNIHGTLDGDAGRLVGEVAVEDMLTGLARLKTQVLTPEWFDPESFPTISFQSTQIAGTPEQATVAGLLTLHGVTKPVTAAGAWHGPQRVRHSTGKYSERLGLDLVTTIDRRDFGLTFNSEIAEGVMNLGWDVKLEATLQMIHQIAD